MVIVVLVALLVRIIRTDKHRKNYRGMRKPRYICPSWCTSRTHPLQNKKPSLSPHSSFLRWFSAYAVCTRVQDMDILLDIFLLKVLGWFTPGISGGPTSTPPPCSTCGTVRLFFDFLLRLYIYVSARFASCLLTFSAAFCKLGFSVNTVLNFFAILSLVVS